MLRISRTAALASLSISLLFCAGCAKGGNQTNLNGEVKLGASHWMVGFNGLTDFTFPLKPTVPFTDSGEFLLSSNGNYSIKRGSTESGAAPYLLAKTGELTVLVPRNNASTLRWSGGYEIDGDLFFFTDRNPTYIGLFAGVREVAVAPNLADKFHAFGNRLVFPKTSVPDKASVGRAWGGTLEVSATGVVTGTVKDSRLATLTLGGSVQGFSDGRTIANLEFNEGSTVEKRTFAGGAGKLVVLGLHDDTSAGDVGLLCMVRRFAAKPDPVRIAGDYLCGSFAIFVNPAQPGTDASFGTLSLNDHGGWVLTASGSNNFQFTKSGTFTVADDGSMVFTEARTGEKYPGAVDTDYATVVMVDATAQDSTNPEVELFLATRIKKP